jgi:hypothetical protein
MFSFAFAFSSFSFESRIEVNKCCSGERFNAGESDLLGLGRRSADADADADVGTANSAFSRASAS